MVRRIGVALAGVLGLFVLSGCGGNGWDALPVDDQDQCFQITKWKSNGWTTDTWAVGQYCRVDPATPGPTTEPAP